jgi:hypothetical protein
MRRMYSTTRVAIFLVRGWFIWICVSVKSRFLSLVKCLSIVKISVLRRALKDTVSFALCSFCSFVILLLSSTLLLCKFIANWAVSSNFYSFSILHRSRKCLLVDWRESDDYTLKLISSTELSAHLTQLSLANAKEHCIFVNSKSKKLYQSWAISKIPLICVL